MSLVVTGLSHHTADVELRERMTFAEDTLPAALSALRERIEGAGAVILSTCNRTEVYVNHAGEPEDMHHDIRSFLAEWHGLSEAEFAGSLYQLDGKEAVGHLFRVASSLDSLVVGEQQILGQVHDAYIKAHKEQATDKVINALFQRAFTVAKKVRSHSRIGLGKVSVSSVAVDLAVSIFMDLSDKTVMVIGSGEMAELTLRHLVAQGVAHVLVANRNADRAHELADEFGGTAVALDALDNMLHMADIVISSTGAPGIVLQADDLSRALRRRDQLPVFVIDIAVPRDVENAANDLDNVYLYDIDDLHEVAEQNLEARREEVDRCLEIVDQGVAGFWHWLQQLVAEPTIVSLSKELNEIREHELEKTLASLDGIDDNQREEIEYLTKRIVNNILQQPLSQIKREAQHEDHASVLQLVRRLFGLSEGT